MPFRAHVSFLTLRELTIATPRGVGFRAWVCCRVEGLGVAGGEWMGRWRVESLGVEGGEWMERWRVRGFGGGGWRVDGEVEGWGVGQWLGGISRTVRPSAGDARAEDGRHVLVEFQARVALGPSRGAPVVCTQEKSIEGGPGGIAHWARKSGGRRAVGFMIRPKGGARTHPRERNVPRQAGERRCAHKVRAGAGLHRGAPVNAMRIGAINEEGQ